MTTQGKVFAVHDTEVFRIKMLNWANQFNIFCFLDHRSDQLIPASFDCILAAGSRASLNASAGNAFVKLEKWRADHPGWCFGHLNYDLKNETEQLFSSHTDGVGFPDLYFFVPETVVQLKDAQVIVYGDDAEETWQAIVKEKEQFPVITNTSSFRIEARFSHDEYLSVVKQLQQHILRGDCYEINFCQEFFCVDAELHALVVYNKLVAVSPNPFAAFYRLEDRYCICASPERYLKKTGDTLISQPIKGTAPRVLHDEAADKMNRDYLRQSPKEQSENVMVVDLVRNDLSRICRGGSVRVNELFGIYSFPQVHQMISTVSGEIESNTGLADVFEATFPMGSMTGAPKKRVMELIEQYERTRRGLFSGSIGYMTPEGDFDFNVVIRSILYNAADHYLSFQTGGAITFYSDAEQEYEECMLKAKAIMTVLQ